jgi:hypothetical protein
VTSQTQSPVLAALIMAAILIVAGILLLVLARQRAKTARQAFSASLSSLRNRVPTVDDVGRQIERAVNQAGPVRLMAAALGEV